MTCMRHVIDPSGPTPVLAPYRLRYDDNCERRAVQYGAAAKGREELELTPRRVHGDVGAPNDLLQAALEREGGAAWYL
jgi:hypothetical protein